jgi:hypothetical protein
LIREEIISKPAKARIFLDSVAACPYIQQQRMPGGNACHRDCERRSPSMKKKAKKEDKKMPKKGK